MLLEGKVAIVTGTSRGLGKEVAQRFEDEGAAVAGCSSETVDVSCANEVVWFVQDVLAKFKRIDILVTNAAIYGPVGPLDAVSLEDWVRAMEVNLFGTVYCCRAVLAPMRAQKYGKIITLSGAGVRPQEHCTAYNASKAAVVRFTEALAIDVEGTGIDVNAVAPGTLDTRMRLRSPMPADPEKAMRQAVDLITFLASSESDGLTGRLLSAVWDDVPAISRASLGPDEYRMRRKVPSLPHLFGLPVSQ